MKKFVKITSLQKTNSGIIRTAPTPIWTLDRRDMSEKRKPHKQDKAAQGDYLRGRDEHISGLLVGHAHSFASLPESLSLRCNPHLLEVSLCLKLQSAGRVSNPRSRASMRRGASDKYRAEGETCYLYDWPPNVFALHRKEKIHCSFV